MNDAAVFILAVSLGAAVLALWLDVRFPALAPEGIVRRGVAALAGCLLIQLGATGFERVLALSLGPAAGPLLALGVLLSTMTFCFVTALWLLRSLQGLGAMR